MGYPRLKYPSGSTTPTTIDFKRGPIDFICEADARSHSSLAASGFRATNSEAVDLLIKFTMPAVRIDDDYQAWAAFAAWAAQGGQFDFWPNISVGQHVHCVSEDLSFAPSHKGVGWYEIQFVWRIEPDNLRPANSGLVMQWYYGIGRPNGPFPFVSLCGAWTDAGGHVVEPVWIGNGPRLLHCPAGATQLQLGVVDGHYTDNVGSEIVAVNGQNVTVYGTSVPWEHTDGINANYPFGDETGTAPVVVAGFSPGDAAVVAYVSGGVGGGGWYPTDCNGDGDPDALVGTELESNGAYEPSRYMM